MPNIHPGEFLAEILAEEKRTQAQFARAIGVSPMRVSHVIHGSRPVTADLALRFGKAFDQTPEYWMNLQAAYDLAIARRAYAAGKRRAKPAAKICIAITAAALLLAAGRVAHADETFYDASGHVAGRSHTDSGGTTHVYDAAGRNAGRASTDTGGATHFTDAEGRNAGSATLPRR